METEQPTVNLPSVDYISLRDIPHVEHISKIRCSSYTTEWIARAVGLHPIPANSLLRGPVWFDMFRPVIPTDMQKLFKLRGMSSVIMDMSSCTDEQRIEWIKREISVHKRPPALLIRTRILHWIAVGGYDDRTRTIFFYDSRYGASSMDPHLPIGNNIMSYDDLMTLWSGRWRMKYKALIVTTEVRTDPKMPAVGE